MHFFSIIFMISIIFDICFILFITLIIVVLILQIDINAPHIEYKLVYRDRLFDYYFFKINDYEVVIKGPQHTYWKSIKSIVSGEIVYSFELFIQQKLVQKIRISYQSNFD